MRLLNNWDDEIHKALTHPLRRRIIECLHQESNCSFNDLRQRLDLYNHGKLVFHLRALRGLVECDPLSGGYQLNDKGLLAAELIWDIRFAISRGGRELALEPERYVRHLRFGDHAVFYYDSEDFKREIVFPFLEAGLQRGEAVIYAVSEDTMDSEIRAVQRYGISPNYFRNEAFTIFSADEWYLKKGKAQTKKIIAHWKTLLNEKQKAGFPGLCVAGEMEIFKRNSKSDELLNYEEALGRYLALDVCALCLYNTDQFDAQEVEQLKKSHGHEIHDGIALQTEVT